MRGHTLDPLPSQSRMADLSKLTPDLENTGRTITCNVIGQMKSDGMSSPLHELSYPDSDAVESPQNLLADGVLKLIVIVAIKARNRFVRRAKQKSEPVFLNSTRSRANTEFD